MRTHKCHHCGAKIYTDDTGFYWHSGHVYDACHAPRVLTLPVSSGGAAGSTAPTPTRGREPNALTREVLAKAERGEDVHGPYETLDEMLADVLCEAEAR